ncbi:MAG: hypothetical protein KDA34_02605 [Phycisphaerales bacterium]|nr:hypothetical protein [Phycisphaerales bacterium]
MPRHGFRRAKAVTFRAEPAWHGIFIPTWPQSDFGNVDNNEATGSVLVPWLMLGLHPSVGGYIVVSQDGIRGQQDDKLVVLQVDEAYQGIARQLHRRAHRNAIRDGTLLLVDAFRRDQECDVRNTRLVFWLFVFFGALWCVLGATAFTPYIVLVLGWYPALLILTVFAKARSVGSSDALPVLYTSDGIALSSGETFLWSAVRLSVDNARLPRVCDGRRDRIHGTMRSFIVPIALEHHGLRKRRTTQWQATRMWVLCGLGIFVGVPSVLAAAYLISMNPRFQHMPWHIVARALFVFVCFMLGLGTLIQVSVWSERWTRDVLRWQRMHASRLDRSSNDEKAV